MLFIIIAIDTVSPTTPSHSSHTHSVIVKSGASVERPTPAVYSGVKCHTNVPLAS